MIPRQAEPIHNDCEGVWRAKRFFLEIVPLVCVIDPLLIFQLQGTRTEAINRKLREVEVFLERIPVDGWKPAIYSFYPPKWRIMSEIGTENGENRG